MTRHFNTFDQYSEYYNEHEHRANDVDVVEYNKAKKPHPDIAARVCTPSELKRTHNGERYPNSREIWLDVQACALSQAARLVCKAVKEVIA